MTRLNFRLLALFAFSLFVAFAISGSGPGAADPKPLTELIGPDTAPEPSLLIPIILLAAALGVLVGYIGMFFLLRWARMTVLLSTVVMAIGQVVTPHHARPGAVWPLFAVGFCVTSLAVAVLSFSAASGLFQTRAQAGANKATAPNGGPATSVGNSGVTEGPPSVS